MNILIVDDDRTCRLILERLFAPMGRVITATNGLEAVEAFQTAFTAGEPFDLVCLDVMMPVLDGQAALREMRAFEQQNQVDPEKRARIAMMTALSDRASVTCAIQGGCDAYLLKPLQKSQVLHKLRSIGLSL